MARRAPGAQRRSLRAVSPSLFLSFKLIEAPAPARRPETGMKAVDQSYLIGHSYRLPSRPEAPGMVAALSLRMIPVCGTAAQCASPASFMPDLYVVQTTV